MKRSITLAVVVAMVMTLSVVAMAQVNEDRHAAFESAAKLPTNIAGVHMIAGPPQGFDPLSASNQELWRYGLPERPDKVADPQKYAVWQRAMLAAKHHADPSKLKAMPFSSTNFRGLPNAPAELAAGQSQGSSLNWSGVVLTNKNKKFNTKTSFDAVYSVFNVPVAEPPFGAPCGDGPWYEVSWNGVDGFFSNTSLVQGGSYSAADCNGNTVYFAWVEWYPSYAILEVFGVNPGDDIFAISYGTPGTANQYVFVEDLTLQIYGTFTLTYVTGPGIIGNSAEFIVERPGGCGTGPYNICPLANTIYDFFNYDFATDGAGASFYAGSTSTSTYNLTMYADDAATIIENVNSSSGAVGKQGSLPLWFVDDNCAYSGGCTE